MSNREIQTFEVTIPPGTLKAAPQISNLAMPARIVNRIEIVVPPGCNGLVGFALGAAGQPVLPYNAGAFVVASGETIGWDLIGQIESGAWQCFGYNTGIYSHTLYLRFYLALPQDSAPAAPPTLIDPGLLTPAGPVDFTAGTPPDDSLPPADPGPDPSLPPDPGVPPTPTPAPVPVPAGAALSSFMSREFL